MPGFQRMATCHAIIFSLFAVACLTLIVPISAQKFNVFLKRDFTGGSSVTVEGGSIQISDSSALLLQQSSLALNIPVKLLTLYFGDVYVDPSAKSLESIGIAKANFKDAMLFTVGHPNLQYDPTKVTLEIDSLENLCDWVGVLNGGAACIHGTQGLCTFVEETVDPAAFEILNPEALKPTEPLSRFSCISTAQYRKIIYGSEGVRVRGIREANKNYCPNNASGEHGMVNAAVVTQADYINSFLSRLGLVASPKTPRVLVSSFSMSSVAESLLPSFEIFRPNVLGKQNGQAWDREVDNHEVQLEQRVDRFSGYGALGNFGLDRTAISCEQITSPSFLKGGGLNLFFGGAMTTKLDEFCAEKLIGLVIDAHCPKWANPNFGVAKTSFAVLLGGSGGKRGMCDDSNVKLSIDYPSGIVPVRFSEKLGWKNADPCLGRENSTMVCGTTSHFRLAGGPQMSMAQLNLFAANRRTN